MASKKDRKLQKRKQREKQKHKSRDQARLQRKREDELASPEQVAEARAIAQRALACSDREEQVRLAYEALEVDGKCPEAIFALADEEQEDEQLFDLLEMARGLAERQLGEEFFSQHEGRFGESPEAQTFLDVSFELALAYWRRGLGGDAIVVAEELLRLEPTDVRELRFVLLTWYLTAQRVDEAAALRERYPDDDLGVLAWAAVLEALQRGDEEAARSAFQRAHERDVSVAGFLVDLDNLPDEPEPEAPVELGNALLVAHMIADAWEATDGAIDWLREQRG